MFFLSLNLYNKLLLAQINYLIRLFYFLHLVKTYGTIMFARFVIYNIILLSAFFTNIG